MVWRILLGILLTLVIVASFAFPIVPAPTSLLEFPFIPGLEEKARIIFFHVPTAWLSVMAFFTGMYYGIKYLRKRDIRDDLRSSAAAGLGLMFCILATVTGMIWAKFNWGSFWNWDPRETSIFVLLLIYGAYFALRSAVEVEEKRATLSALVRLRKPRPPEKNVSAVAARPIARDPVTASPKRVSAAATLRPRIRVGQKKASFQLPPMARIMPETRSPKKG